MTVETVYRLALVGGAWKLASGHRLSLPDGSAGVLYRFADLATGRAANGQDWQVTGLVSEWHPSPVAAAEPHRAAMRKRHEFEVAELDKALAPRSPADDHVP
jgi:hypothetical protein